MARSLSWRYFLICLMIIFATEPVDSQKPQIPVAPDTGESIIKYVLARAKENELQKKELLTYQRVFTINNLDDNEEEIDTEREEVVLIDFGGKEKVIEAKLHGKPVKKNKTTSPRFNLMNILDAMIKLDNFNVVRIEKIEDRHFYVISFNPKSKMKPNGDTEDVIIRSEGEIYVDIEKFYIKKLSARLIRDYERALGLFSLSRANIEMELDEFKGIVVMKSIILVDKYWIIFKGSTFEKQKFTYKDYRKKI